MAKMPDEIKVVVSEEMREVVERLGSLVERLEAAGGPERTEPDMAPLRAMVAGWRGLTSISESPYRNCALAECADELEEALDNMRDHRAAYEASQ